MSIAARPTHAILGAGIAGLACARALQAHGHAVTLFDKGRGPGGRLASRRLDDSTAVDLGAPYFSVRHPAFRHAVAAWERAAQVAPWPQHHYRASGGDWQPHADTQARYVGVPRMSAVTRHLARGLPLLTATRIRALRPSAAGWWLDAADASAHGPFDRVVISAPAPQAQALLAAHAPELAAACAARPLRPCWAVWLRFAAPLPPLPGVVPEWQAVSLHDGPLRYVARNQHKPGRVAQGESLTLLADATWSATWLEAPASEVIAALTAALRAALPDGAPPLPAPQASGAHRWRYAQPLTHPAAGPDYRLAANGLALCGDAWRGGRVEDAWLSGHHLGQALCALSPEAPR